MTHLTPFLLFDGNCAEAMTFYQSCLGGELTITRLGDTPMREQHPPERHHRVVHAHLKSGAIEFAATDWLHPTRAPQQGNMVGLIVRGDTATELQAIFNRLAAGADARLLDPLRALPFGTYGHLADKYGVPWFFVAAAAQ